MGAGNTGVRGCGYFKNENEKQTASIPPGCCSGGINKFQI